MSRNTGKPENLRANVRPVDGFVLTVDGKLKARFETSAEAVAAATKLKQSFPVIQASVYDAIARTYMPMTLEEKALPAAEA